MKIFNWLALMLALMMSGCSNSRITHSWKAENTVPQKFMKVMVLGLIRENDKSLQEKMENHFVGDLQSLGYNAVSSISEYGPKAFENMDEATALEKLKNSGIDAIITIILLNKEKENRLIPGESRYEYTYYSSKFWGYRTMRYRHIYEPGYYVTDTKYLWESNFYDMNSQKLLYSVQTQTFDPLNAEAMGHQYGQMIVKNMLKQNLLMKINEPPKKGF